MNWNQDQNKANSKFKETKQSNFFIPRNPSQNSNIKSQNSNFASRDRNYQQNSNFQKVNYVKEQKLSNPNPFDGNIQEAEVNLNQNEIEAKNSPEYYSQTKNSANYANYLENRTTFQAGQDKQEKNINNVFVEPKKTTKKVKKNYSNLLHEDENQFFNYLADAKSVVEISDLNAKMNYREQHTSWINSFYQLNFEIFQKHEKTIEKKLNPLEKLWKNISFTAKSVYYTIITFFVSFLMLIFWLIFAGFGNFIFWPYIVFVGSFIAFLMIIQVLIYFNNSKNRQKSQKIIFYYILDSSFLLTNYLVRLIFLLSPLFTDKLIFFIINENILKITNNYIEILYYISWFPTLSYFFGICFFIPIKWSECIKNFWLTFGIFKIFSYLNLVKEYRIKVVDETLRKKLNAKWCNLYQIGRPLSNSLHPAFIYAYNVIKTNPNLPIEEQDKLVGFVFNSVSNDMKKYY
ncbi:hypothetical protein ABKJ22_02195 [Mesomycoplasma hyopneumoniae]|uniref:hypothetical protein n=1 Tax=Mesomycoplasma hyopneumoniae TaxID=2099 RepID=UPI0032AEA9B9